jgi:hypothetical protein
MGGDPRFVGTAGTLATGDRRLLNSVTTVAGNAFDVEDGDRHTALCSDRGAPGPTD